MAAAAPAPPTISTNHPIGDGDDSNLSSPLSEVDDKDGEPDDPDNMTLDHPAPQEEDLSDSDVLSEANDTEAETERLYDTPQASRQRNLVLSQIDEEGSTQTTPTKPSTVVVASAPRDADDSLSDVDMSAPPSSPPEYLTSPIKPTRSPTPEDNSSILEVKKRKRSVAERSDSEAPLRKRTGSVGASGEETTGKNANATDSDARHNEPKSLRSSAGASPGERGENAEDAEGDGSPAPEPVVSKKMTRNGSKQAKAAIANGADNEDRDDAPIDDEVEGRQDDEGGEADAEDDLDAAARHDEEEAEKKRVALEEWTAIEQKFIVFRDRLYKDRLEKLESEERALTADVPYHAEYLNMKQCLDELQEEKLQKINKEYEYTLRAHDEVAVSRRAMAWGQFYQGVREKRLEMMSELNREWHDTQNARRHAHSAPDYALLFPSEPAQRVRNAVAYNTEVSVLAGMAIHEGFPSAPSMHGVSTTEVEEDLDSIKRARRQRQQLMMQQQHNSTQSGALDATGEQFVRNTPWLSSNHQHQHQKAAAGPSFEGQGGAQAKPARVNGQHPAHPGPDKSQYPVVSVSAESVRSPTKGNSQGQPKRVRSLQEPSGPPAKTSQEPGMARQGLLGAYSGS